MLSCFRSLATNIASNQKYSGYIFEIVCAFSLIVMLHAHCAVHGYGNKHSLRRFANPRICPGSFYQIYNSHLICHVYFRDENRALKNVLKKNAIPSLFLLVPTVERRMFWNEYWRSMAETTAVTLDFDGLLQVWLYLEIAIKLQYEISVRQMGNLHFEKIAIDLAGSSAAASNSNGVDWRSVNLHRTAKTGECTDFSIILLDVLQDVNVGNK
ncbi:hypothetical protein Trydic_g19932 [Trypoxylus dichotomus]